MATSESQSSNDGNSAILATGALPGEPVVSTGMSRHDWITYLMLIGTACVTVGVPLVLLGDAWNHSTMVLIGAICFTVSTAVWTSLLVFFTWKAVEAGRTAVPLLWRRIRR